MKRLLLVLFVLVSVSSAFAAELKLSGDAMVQGNYWGQKLEGGESTTQAFLEYDFNINAAIVVNEAATIITKLTYDKNVLGSGSVAEGDGSQTQTSAGALALERAFISYKVAPFFMVNTGLMQGGVYATKFGETETNMPRIQLVGILSKDLIFAFTYEKVVEMGATYGFTEEGETNDRNGYLFSATIGLGPVKIMPLMVIHTAGAGYNDANDDNNGDLLYLNPQLGVYGDFGMIGMEAEFQYRKTSFSGDDTVVVPVTKPYAYNDDTDPLTAMGLYVNVFAKLDPAKVGLAVVYTTADETTGYSFAVGDEFDFTIVYDDIVKGSTGMANVTAAKLYGEMKMDKLTIGAAFAMGQSTNTDLADEDFWEVDATVNYALDANTSYEIGFGYASMTDNNLEATATQYTLYHKLGVKF